MAGFSGDRIQRLNAGFFGVRTIGVGVMQIVIIDTKHKTIRRLLEPKILTDSSFWVDDTTTEVDSTITRHRHLRTTSEQDMD